jgi:hypothetical protein
MEGGKINFDVDTSESSGANTFVLKRLNVSANSPSVEVDFSHNQAEGEHHRCSQICHSFPVFNFDSCHFTPAFILDLDRVPLFPLRKNMSPMRLITNRCIRPKSRSSLLRNQNWYVLWYASWLRGRRDRTVTVACARSNSTTTSQYSPRLFLARQYPQTSGTDARVRIYPINCQSLCHFWEGRSWRNCSSH